MMSRSLLRAIESKDTSQVYCNWRVNILFQAGDFRRLVSATRQNCGHQREKRLLAKKNGYRRHRFSEYKLKFLIILLWINGKPSLNFLMFIQNCIGSGGSRSYAVTLPVNTTSFLFRQWLILHLQNCFRSLNRFGKRFGLSVCLPGFLALPIAALPLFQTDT